MSDKPRPLPRGRLLSLLHAYRDTPGIAKGILAEHRRRGGEEPRGSQTFATFLDELLGGNPHARSGENF